MPGGIALRIVNKDWSLIFPVLSLEFSKNLGLVSQICIEGFRRVVLGIKLGKKPRLSMKMTSCFLFFRGRGLRGFCSE